MNLRALQLSLAIGLATAASLVAQPVTVGIHLVPGFNAISTPLIFGGNSVGELFPIAPPGSIFYKYNAQTGAYVTNRYASTVGGWQVNAGFGGSLRPGEAAWFYAPSPVDFSLAGDRLASPPVLSLRLPGFNFVGCPNTQPCSFNDTMGFTPAVGDEVYRFDQPSTSLPGTPNLAQAASSRHQFGPNGWDSPPVFGVGRGMFVFLADAPRVTIQPSRLVVAAGTTAQFHAVPLGGIPTAYRWRFEGVPLAVPSSSNLVLQRVGPTNEGRYTVDVTFGGGLVVTSLAARLVVTIAPAIVRPPLSHSVIEGMNAKFDVVATGSKPLYYQWRRGGVALTPFARDQTNLVLSSIKASDAGSYDVAVSNFAGVVFSPAAQLNVLIPPRILVQPRSQMAGVGQDVTLFVQADGTPPLIYQWRLNGNPIPGANSAMLTITNAQATNSGSYRVTVANMAGAVDSTQAVVRVDAPDFPFSDNFGGGAVLGGMVGVVRGRNIGASLEAGEPRPFGKRGGRSVWTSYLAPGTGIVTFRTRGSTFDTLLGAYTGSAVGALNELVSDEDRAGFLTSEIRFNVRQGELSRIAIDGLAGAEGEFILSWLFESTPELLPIILTHPVSRTVAQGGIATFNVQATGGAIGYQWFLNNQPIPNASQPNLTVPDVQPNLVGEYFARLQLGNRFVDTRPVDLEINAPDAGGVDVGARSYDKFVDLVDATGGTPGRLVPAAPPVLGYTGSQVFNNNAAGGQDGEPVHCGVIGGASRWFSYIAPAQGTFFLNTDGSSFDTLLAVYRGCCDFEDLTLVECDNNSGTNGLTSSLSLPATNGFVYYIAVDGVNGARGTVKLNYRLLVPITLTNLANTTNSLTFKLTATPSYPFTIQRTTNLVDWAPLMTTNSANGNFTFTDTNLPPPRRFLYRSMQVP